jgi:hypothetical protein
VLAAGVATAVQRRRQGLNKFFLSALSWATLEYPFVLLFIEKTDK